MIYELWNSTEQSRRAINPVDDSREGIEKYLKRNPTTCFLAYTNEGTENRKIAGVILTGHDGRRAIVHHLCVHPDFCRQGAARMLVKKAEEALRKEGIAKVFGLVFKVSSVYELLETCYLIETENTGSCGSPDGSFRCLRGLTLYVPLRDKPFRLRTIRITAVTIRAVRRIAGKCDTNHNKLSKTNSRTSLRFSLIPSTALSKKSDG